MVVNIRNNANFLFIFSGNYMRKILSRNEELIEKSKKQNITNFP